MRAEEFSEALAPHFDDVARYCRALCAGNSPDEAEDVLQQALLRALRAYGGLREQASFRAWLFRIVTNTYHTEMRRHFWRRFVPLSSVGGDDVDEFPGVYRTTPMTLESTVLHRALSELQPRERAALLLYEVAGFSVGEIAAIQSEASNSAVKSRLSRVRARLRNALQSGVRAKTSTTAELEMNLERATLKLINGMSEPEEGTE